MTRRAAVARSRASRAAAETEEDKKRKVLERSVFAALSDEGLREVLRRARFVEVQRKERFPLRDEGAMYVVASGRVRVALPQEEDREITLDYYGPHDLVGETTLVDGAAPAEAVAADRVEALKVPAALVKRMLGREVRFASKMAALMGARRVDLEQRIVALLTRPVESRVAEFLLEAADRYGVPDPRGTLIGVKFTHVEIASYVGSTRETVTLILGEFKRKKLVAFDHRRVVVLNRGGLNKRV